jgi:hypothetical protein
MMLLEDMVALTRKRYNEDCSKAVGIQIALVKIPFLYYLMVYSY